MQRLTHRPKPHFHDRGKNQVDYRFFIGLKLLVNEQEVTMKQFRREAKTAVSDFLHEVNHKLMGDFVSMSNEEIWRFQKMEKLLENKISRRFKVGGLIRTILAI